MTGRYVYREPEVFEAFQFDPEVDPWPECVYQDTSKPKKPGKPFVYTDGDWTDDVNRGDWVVTDESERRSVWTDDRFRAAFVAVEVKEA